MTTHKKIGLVTATIVCMNAMIGAGIFSVPVALQSEVGPAGLVTYLFVILAVWCMALSLARVAALYPQEGSFYTYARQWGGEKIGIAAATSYLIGLVIAMGLLAQIAALYMQEFINIPLKPLAVLILIALVLLNILGVKLSELGQQVLIVCTLTPLALITTICFSHANLNNLFPFMPYGFFNALLATKAVIFGFFGFEAATSLYSVTENPAKNVPRAVTTSIVAVGLIYLAFVSSILLAIPTSSLNNPSTKLTDLVASVLPGYTWLITVITIGIICATIGTLHSMIWSVSSLMVSLNTLMRKKSGVLSHRKAVLSIGLCIIAACITLNDIDMFFNLTALFIVFALVTAILTLVIKHRHESKKQTVLALIGLLTAGIIIACACDGIIIALQTR